MTSHALEDAQEDRLMTTTTVDGGMLFTPSVRQQGEVIYYLI